MPEIDGLVASMYEWSADCNSDGIVDYGQILDGTLADSNGNGVPDICDSSDTDGDGVPDSSDGCPTNAGKTAAGACGCSFPDTDTDSDGVIDCLLAENLPPTATLAGTGILANDDFGASVAISGDFAAIGAPLDDLTGKTDAGTVRVFNRSGLSWTQSTLLQAPDALAQDRFGAAVALSGDLLVVGAPLANLGAVADAGAAYVFRRSGSTWTFEQKLTRPSGAATDKFGTSVAARGDLIAVGSPFANRSGVPDSGEVTIFRRDGSAWVVASSLGSSPPTASDQFGAAVAFSGPTGAAILAVGAPGDDETGKANCGAVYVPAIDTVGTVLSTARLIGQPAIANAGLGASVRVDSSGTRVAAGAPLADFTGMTDRGSVSIWTFAADAWSGVNVAHAYLAAGEKFGASLAWTADDACLVVGSPGDKIGTVVNRGSVSVLSRRGDGSYQLHDLLVLPASGTSASLFGTSVAADATGVLVGAPKHTPPAGGTARMFAVPSPCAGVDTDSDGIDDCSDPDDDGDGTPDGSDLCGRDPFKIAPGTCGCGVADTDSDSDGTPNCNDGCPTDAAKIAPGQCGCGVADTDSDADGTANCNDGCPSDAAKTSPGICGCGTPETGDTDGDELVDCLDFDDDNDGVNDGSDACPLDAAKTAPGQWGCGVPDTDSDADGTADCNDGCDDDAGKTAPGVCGCGTPDVDADVDGLMDCLGQGTLEETGSLPTTGVVSGDDFGAAVAADGDAIVVGVPLDDVPSRTDAGSARVYRKVADAWTQEAQFLAPITDAKAKDYFGTSVALYGDVAVIGSPSTDLGALTDAGAAYVFRRVGGTWTYETRLVRPAVAANDKFGTSVAVRGDLIAVGAPLANAAGLADSGEVTVFRYAAGVWTLAEILTSGPVAAGDKFGQAVALGGSVGGPTLAVGAIGDDQPGKLNCGAVYIHTLEADGALATATRLVAATPIANAGLGTSVAVDASGARVASGAPLGDRSGIGVDSGLLTVWQLAGGAWTATDVNPPDHAAGERLGSAVAFTPGNLLVAGSPYDTVGGVAQRGSVAVFRPAGSAWAMYDRLVIGGGTSASRFGTAVGAGSAGIAVGAPKHMPPVGGAVRVFEMPSTATLAWATTLEDFPDPSVVTDATLRAAIVSTGLPWRVRDNASQIEMLLIPPGSFQMGCSASGQYGCNPDEIPAHMVTLTDAFYIGRYEVKQSEWQAVMGSNPSYFQGPTWPLSESHPVEYVSWEMIQTFNAVTGLRLPTEAEWEYSCRAGTATAFHGFAGHLNGTNDDSLLGEIAWFSSNSGDQTHPVGQRAANTLGLHDMLGNVWELVSDWWSMTYYQSSPLANPAGPSTGEWRAMRGGPWFGIAPPQYCRTSARGRRSPYDTDAAIGFRVAKTP